MLEFKIIKRLDQRTYCQKAHSWITHIPFFTRIILIVVTLWTFVCLVFAEPYDSFGTYMSWVLACNNVSELLVFYGIVVSTLYDQEMKGSSPFFINMLVKFMIMWPLGFAMWVIFNELPIIHNQTSVPVLVGFMTVCEDGWCIEDTVTFIMGLPFQIKKVFYPTVLIIILELIEYRIDIVWFYILGLFFGFVGFGKMLDWVGRRIEKQMCRCFLNFQCFIKTNQEIIKEKPLQHVVTSNSVVFEDI